VFSGSLLPSLPDILLLKSLPEHNSTAVSCLTMVSSVPVIFNSFSAVFTHPH